MLSKLLLSPELLFLSVFIGTIFAVRVFVYIAPSRTITGFLRHRTLLYVHHIFAGIVLLAITIPFFLLHGLTTPILIMAAIGLALCLDELSAWILFVEYPSRKETIYTILLVLVFAVYVISL